MKKILVPTDFSECAIAAANYGLSIARRANAEIHFLHIITPPVDWVKLPLEKEHLYPETKAEIGRANHELNQLKSRAEKLGLKAEVFLSFNKSRDGIDQHIKEHGHDLIVMGSHGASGFKELIGSNTQKVVRHSPAPVLVVKNEPDEQGLKNLVFASTFERDAQAPFQKVLAFADLMDAHVHLVYVNVPYDFKETEEIEERMNPFISQCSDGSCSSEIYNALNVEQGIRKFAASKQADLISLATHGKTGFLRMFSPSIAESLGNHAELPVLSFNSRF